MTALAPTRLPGTLTLGLARASVELKTFFRQRDAVVFTFALPIVIMLVLGSVFANDAMTVVTASQHLAAGLIAGGIASTSFVNLGIGITNDRENGTLRRLRGTPIPPAAYFVGKILLVLIVSAAEALLMVVIAVVAFDLPVPRTLDAWATFGWVFLLGVGACSLLGIALSSLARSISGAAAMTNLALIVLQFVSGVYVLPLRNLPDPLVMIGSLFPLKWMAQGLRSVFLPEVLAQDEVAGTWEHGRTALVLAAWCIGGLVLCLTTFRWRGRRER
jgi:ABC-2 type transport system permease protein